MRVRDDASIIKMVRTSDVREKTVKEENVSLLRRHCRNLLAFWDVVIISTLDWGVQSFRMVIEILRDACCDNCKQGLFLKSATPKMLTSDTVFGQVCSAATRWNVSEAVDDGYRIPC